MRIRRAALLTIAATMVLSGFPALPGVEPRSASALTAAEINARIDSLTDTLRAVAEDLQAAENELITTDAEIAAHDRALSEAQRRRGELTEALSHRAAQLYVLGSVSDLELITDGVGSTIDRLTYLEAIRRGERGLLEEVRALQRRSEEVSALLGAARDRAMAARRRLAERQRELSSQLAELKRLQAFLGEGDRFVIGGGNGFVCPVVGPNVPLSNFGDPRPGGPHAGVDIRADYGQYVRAPLAGTIVDMPTGSWWGYGIIVRDLSGTEWYYAHLSSRSVHVGQRVASGEVIGRVGCSGTCYGPHLHFEWHPDGGGPRDPYGIVSRAC